MRADPEATMILKSILTGWLARRGHRTGAMLLRVQVVGMSRVQHRQLETLCDRLGGQLDLALVCDTQGGEIVMADPRYVARAGPQHMARLCAARPLVLCDIDEDGDAESSSLAKFALRQRELLAQLRRLPQVRDRSPRFGASGWDQEVVSASCLPSGFDDPAAQPDSPVFPASQWRPIVHLLRGLVDPEMPPLLASFGPSAMMRVDFSRAFALIDPQAQQMLRVNRALPRLEGATAPGDDAIERELDALVWDIGIAAGVYRLLNAPPDSWHTALATCQDPAVQRYTRLPRHLDLAAALFSGPISPADLQRRTGQSVAEIRPFLQACLFLGLAWWSPLE